MPNWCDNIVYISGSKEELNKFKSLLQTSENEKEPYLYFQKILPSENEDVFPLWKTFNWGTNWDLDNEQNRYYREDCFEYYFSTAWSPPIPIFEYVSTLFPELKIEIRYYEPSVSLVGRTIIQAGFIDDKEFDINEDKEEYFRFIEENFVPSIREEYESE